MKDLEYESLKAKEADYRAQRRKRKKDAPAAVRYLWDQADPPIRWEDLTSQWRNYITQFLSAYIELDLAPDRAWASTCMANWPDGLDWQRALTRMALAHDESHA